MITLTHRAEQCLRVLHTLDRGELLMAEAAELLGLSVRQVRRLRGVYRSRGAAALVHGNRGRPAPNRIGDDVRDRTAADVNAWHRKACSSNSMGALTPGSTSAARA